MRHLVGLGAAAALVGGLSLVWLGGAPGASGSPAAVGTGPVGAPGPAPVATAGSRSSCADAPGTPVRITVDGARAQGTPVEAHPLGDVEDGRRYDGALYVPRDPSHVSWLAYTDVGPGADHGSAVLAGHVNYAHVPGALGDLPAYRAGQRIQVTLQDGRVLTYRVVPAAAMGFATAGTALAVSKEQLDADPGLNARIFDFDARWSGGGPACGRLVLVTCGGRVVDHRYEDNVFVFALPEEADPPQG